MRWLLANWELKLVALGVALALWTYTSGQVRTEREAVIEIRSDSIAGLPGNLQVVSVTPREFTVVLSVPTRKLDEVGDGALRPRLVVRREEQRPGPIEFPVTSHALGLDGDIRILRTDPADLRAITVVLARIVEEPLPVQAPEIEGLPAGIGAEVILDRTQVRVRGPEDALHRAQTEHAPVRFSPVRLAGIDQALAGEREERVSLVPLPALLLPIEPVSARIILRPARRIREELRLPVQLLLPAAFLGRWVVDPADPEVSIRVSGPENLVRALKTDELAAWIDLRHPPESADPTELPVQVTGPAWLVCEPMRVRLAVKPAAKPAP